jgi:hypothetical protein
MLYFNFLLQFPIGGFTVRWKILVYGDKISYRTITCQWQVQGYEWHEEPPF